MPTTEKLEEIANECLSDARELRDSGDIEKARIYFALSWGFNKYLERMDFLEICTRSLKLTDLDPEEVKLYQVFGEDMATYSMELTDAINNILSKLR